MIGSGIGGLCCAALCARAGLDVLVLEAHGHAGGAAHGFERQGFQFESGPSLWSGLGRWPSNNPLAQILRALDEPLEVISYREWDVLFPEGHLSIGVGADGFERVVGDLRGAEAVEQWRRFAEVLKPIAAAADALPLLALPLADWMAWDPYCVVVESCFRTCRRCVISVVPSGLWWIVICRTLFSGTGWICCAS